MLQQFVIAKQGIQKVFILLPLLLLLACCAGRDLQAEASIVWRSQDAYGQRYGQTYTHLLCFQDIKDT